MASATPPTDARCTARGACFHYRSGAFSQDLELVFQGGGTAVLEVRDPAIIRERLGSAVKDVTFDRDVLRFPFLSPQHMRIFMKRNVGPLQKLVQALDDEAAKLAALRAELELLINEYFENNFLRQDFLMTRAYKI